MIPRIEEEIEEKEKKEYLNKTYFINFNSHKIEGYLTDDIECLKQSLYLLLNTEKFLYPIYKQYGFKFQDLINSEKEFFLSSIKKRVEEAVLIDDRVEKVLSIDTYPLENEKDSYIIDVKIKSIFRNDIIEIRKEFKA